MRQFFSTSTAKNAINENEKRLQVKYIYLKKREERKKQHVLTQTSFKVKF